MKTIQAKRMDSLLCTEELATLAGREVTLHGSVHKIRKMSGFAFLILRTSRQLIQCVYVEDETGLPLSRLREEACVEITGRVISEIRSRTGWELRVESLRIVSEPFEELPVVINQRHVQAALDTLLEYRPVTLRNEYERAIFRVQEGLCSGMRRYLQSQQFVEIHSPKIGSAGAEGGANVFHLNYFGKDACLAQSPQFYKQMMVGVYERVFEIGPVFRAEKHSTSRHLNEYTSVDLEMGYMKGYEELMRLETAMLQEAFAFLARECPGECELLKIVMPKITEIPALTFAEAKAMVSKTYRRPVMDALDLEPEEERLICAEVARQTGSDFVFITEYPSEKRPFYTMDSRENPKVTQSFDLLFRGVEVTTGGQRIHSYREQVEKLQNRGIPLEPLEGYLMMHRFGMPPHGGLGIGLERLTARLLTLENVRRASLVPRDIHRIAP